MYAARSSSLSLLVSMGEVVVLVVGRVMVWMPGGQRVLEASRPPKMKALLARTVRVWWERARAGWLRVVSDACGG